MVKIIFYGGVNEIGGNRILIDDAGTKVFFDFGKSFAAERVYFSGRLRPRSTSTLKDYLEFNLLPKLTGLYAQEEIEETAIPYKEPEYAAIILSHAHMDHVEHIALLDPKIPVYLSPQSRLFIEAIEKTTSGADFGEHQYMIFENGDKLTIDNITVEPMPVDHSILGACGFIIHTSEGTIVYTGDFRLHGPRRDLTQAFIQKAIDSKPDLLITEGTRVMKYDRRRNTMEKHVAAYASKLANTGKLVLFTQYSRDLTRLQTFYEAAVKSNRQMVISTRMAYALNLLSADKTLSLPNPMQNPNIQIYFRRKKGGTYSEKDYYIWERQFMAKKVTEDFIRQNQSKIMLNLDVQHFAELIDIKPEAGSHFIYSMSEPFSEEDVEERLLHTWLSHFGIIYHRKHASGHIQKEQLIAVMKDMAPKKIFPIHTQNPQLFRKMKLPVQIVEQGKEYFL